MKLTKQELKLLNSIDHNRSFFKEVYMEKSVIIDTKYIFILKAEELRLLLYLKSWNYRPSIDKISFDLNLSDRSIWRLLRGLKDKGFIFPALKLDAKHTAQKVVAR